MMLAKIKHWASKLKVDIVAIYIASTDRRTPQLAKLIAVAIATYAFSPIDLIPDFIPVLGLLDDLIIVPAGIALIIRLIPPELMNSFRQQAKTRVNPSSNRKMGIFIVAIWMLVGLLIVCIVVPMN